MTIWLSCQSRSNVPQMGFPEGIGFVRIHRPHAYWKKSWQGSTDVSIADIINAEALTHAALVHKPHLSSITHLNHIIIKKEDYTLWLQGFHSTS